MEIKIVERNIDNREWHVGDMFLLDDGESRMIVKYDNLYCTLDLECGHITYTGFESIDELMDWYMEDFVVKYMKATLTLTEE